MLWNKLPAQMQKAVNITVFNGYLKTYLFKRAHPNSEIIFKDYHLVSEFILINYY